jgi:hypothetical protein
LSQPYQQAIISHGLHYTAVVWKKEALFCLIFETVSGINDLKDMKREREPQRHKEHKEELKIFVIFVSLWLKGVWK